MTDTYDSQPGTAAPPSAGTPAAPPAGSSDDPLGTLPDDQAVFNRGYVEKVRNEAQRYRQEATTARDELGVYNDVFGVYPQEDREVWFQLARDWAQDPARAASVMQQIAAGVLGDQPAAAEPETPPPATDFAEAVTKTMTPEEVRAMIDESLAMRDRSAMEQKAINDVFAEVRAAGFDPDTTDGFMVLYNANHYTNGDIAKAVEMVKARDQKVIDDFVAGRSGRPIPSPNGVTAMSSPEPIKNIEDARRATEAFLRERQSAG